jgi:penicillin-binding protein 1A
MNTGRTAFKLLFALGFLILLLVVGGGIWAYRSVTVDLPNIESVRDYRPCVISRVFDANGELLGEFFIEKREVVSLERIPRVLLDAVVAAEDANFYQHEGLDFLGILRALLKNIQAGGIVQGGSTITQQVVKSLLLTPERSLRRKIREAILAYRLERSLSKDEILYLYLNQIYFGHGAYGVQIASESYFGHDVEKVTLAEAALLAGLPRAPSRYSPARHPEKARERQAYVLQQMRSERMITDEEMKRALEEPLGVTNSRNINEDAAPYFVDFVREYLLESYGKEMTFCGGLQVYTTIDKLEQEAAQEGLNFGVGEYGKRHPKETAQDDAESIQGALLSMDLPSGAVRAMVGGIDHSKSQFNRAIHAKRQPGSAIKPVIYSAALDRGFTPASIVVDSPIVFDDRGLEERWKPKNYSRRFVGPTTLRDALTNSRNVVTIKVLKEIGVGYAMRYAQRMGIPPPVNEDLSFALGSSESTLLEMVGAYAVFACQGNRPEPLFILRVLDAKGELIEEHEPRTVEVISPQTAYLMTSLLQSVVQEGTGKAVRALGVPCAGKTGTTNEYRDAWFIGYTPEKIVGVWMGYDQSRNLGAMETGGRVAAPVWLHFMKNGNIRKSGRPFPIPPGIVFANVDTRTGLLATARSPQTRLECFLEGTEPKEYAEELREPEGFDFFLEDTEMSGEVEQLPESETGE